MQYSMSEIQLLRRYQEMHKCGSETLAAGKGVSHQPRLGFAASYSLGSASSSLISSRGIQCQAGSHSSLLGHAVAVGFRSAVDAACQTSAALAPATATNGPAIHSSITSSSGATASCTQSNININSSSANLPQRICTNCGANHSAANTWRAGPAGPRTLCNKCGLQYKRHGAVALDNCRVSRTASTVTPELADVTVAELPAAQPQLARSYSSYSNYVGKTESSTVQHSTTGSVTSTAAAPDAALIASNTYSSLGAAAAPMQPRPKQQPDSITAEQAERSGTRRSLRKRKPRVAFGEVDYLELERGATTGANTSLTAAAVTAANGSQTQKSQRQKRARQTGDEGEVLRPIKTTRTRELAPAAAAAASAAASAPAVLGGILQADSAVPVHGASREPISMMAVPNVDMQAEAVQLLSVVAPGPAGFRARKSSRIAQRKARQCEAVTSSMAAAAEAEEAAEALLDMAGFCWMEGLVAALGDELDTY